MSARNSLWHIPLQVRMAFGVSRPRMEKRAVATWAAIVKETVVEDVEVEQVDEEQVQVAERLLNGFNAQMRNLTRDQLRVRCVKEGKIGKKPNVSSNGAKDVLRNRLAQWYVRKYLLKKESEQVRERRTDRAQRVPNAPYARWYALRVMRSVAVRRASLLTVLTSRARDFDLQKAD